MIRLLQPSRFLFILLSFILLSLLPGLTLAQTFHYRLEGQALLGSSGSLPFWLRANQHGSVPLPGPGLSLLGRVARDYDTTRSRLFDWGVALEGRANASIHSPHANLFLVEGYARMRLAMFELRAGRSKNSMGLVDTLLSTGSLAVSGTAPGIPQVQLSIPDFYPVPFTKRWLAIKGNVAHGWIGSVSITNKRVSQARTYFHQKSLYVRLGKPNGSFRLYGGYNDQAFWGSERHIFESFTLTDWQSFQSVLYGKNWAGSKIGNHVGTLDGGIELAFKNIRLLAYRQQLYDVGALYYLANVADGLTGVSITNRRPASGSRFHWQKALVELIYTKNQAGKLSSPQTPSGRENYYNHYLYTNGYSYQGYSLGTPLIASASTTRSGLPLAPGNYFLSNRLWGIHTGLTGKYQDAWKIQLLATYARHFGTYETSGIPYQEGGGQIVTPAGPVFQPVGQLSFSLSLLKAAKNNRYWGGSLVSDLGGLYPASVGLLLKAGWQL